MRNFTFKGLFLAGLFMVLGCLSIKAAADEGLITRQVTIKLDEAGTLPNRIAVSRKNLITNLKIVGKINGTDLKFIREMAGRDYNLNKTDGKLSILDLSEAKIVAGGDAYVPYGNKYTSNDKLGDYAFYRCSRLTNLILPSSVTEIGWGAFDGCSGLTSMTIPSGVTWIGVYAFYGCSGLTSLTLPSSVTGIGSEAFKGCSGLTSLTLPSSVTSVGGSAFEGCSGLTSLTLPSSVTSIGKWAFKGCSGLTSLTIPSSVTSIGIAAFEGCSGLTSLTLLSGVTSIGNSAFSGCSGLTSLTIPSSVTSIGESAFAGCSGLTSLTIPSSVTSIGESAFVDCSGLTSLTILSGVTEIGNYAFSGCSGLTSLALPSSVTSIGDWAFEDCSGLTSLTIPSSVTSIGESAFKGCSGLTSIYAYLVKIPKLGSNVFTGCDAKNCILYVPKGTIDDYLVSEFGYFENIVDDGLLTTQVTIKLDEAGTLPDRIGENQKNLITNLKIVGKINGTDLKFIREMAGRDFNRKKTKGKLSILDLSEAKIVAGGDAYVGYGENNYTSYDMLGDFAFQGCSGLTSLTIPSSVTSIGYCAFASCSGLKSLTIPSSVTSIGIAAFEDCSGLTSLTIPSGVTSISNFAFQDCSGLTSLTLPSSVTSIGDRAFEDCSGLTSLTIPSGVTSIGDNAFRVSGLTSLTIPSSVTSIGESAFSCCYGLTSIYVYTKKIPKLGYNVFLGCYPENCTVYVPKGTYDAYKSSEFGYFENIVEFDPTGINNVITSNDAKELSRYSLNGQRLSAPTKGLNIVKYSDGSVKKVVVQ